MSQQGLVMMSSVGGASIQEGNQRKLQSTLDALGVGSWRIQVLFAVNCFHLLYQVSYTNFDASLAENVERRNHLFGISGVRGNYPQFFLVNEDGSEEFVGVWEALEGLIDGNTIPADVLEANPGIPTLNKVLLYVYFETNALCELSI